MNTPLIEAAFSNTKEQNKAHYIKKFSEAVTHLEDGLRAQQIWNQEYEDVKYWFNHVCEAILSDLTHKYYDESVRDKNVPQGDVRWDIHYFFTPIHALSYLRKVQKAQKTHPTQLLQEFHDVLFEMSVLYDRLKQVKPYIVKGRKPNPNAVAPDLSHTGHCGICQAQDIRVTKLGPGNKLVDHGFQISAGWGNYFGFRNGHCFGVKYQPLELSCQANKDFLVSLHQQLKSFEETLIGLRAGTAQIPVQEKKSSGRPGMVWIGPSDARYVKELPFAITNTEDNIRHVKSAITYQEDIIKNWVATPLLYGGYEK
jgi:hypothetical protein